MDCSKPSTSNYPTTKTYRDNYKEWVESVKKKKEEKALIAEQVLHNKE